MGIHQLQVSELHRETPWSIRLRLDLDGVAFRFSAGQAVTLGLPGGPRKPYSIACSPEAATRDGALEFLIQTDAAGALGANLAGITSGSLVEVEGPFGRFHLPRPLRHRRLLLIAGGTGISPLRAITDSALARPNPPLITLLYSAQTADDFAFMPELRRAARSGRLHLVLTVTRSGDPRWTSRRGRVQEAWFDELLRDGPALCFVCGPPSFVTDVSRMLESLGVPPGRIKHEEY